MPIKDLLQSSGSVDFRVLLSLLHEWMQEHHKTLALAESCTGGFMSSQITLLPGASDYFLGSLVTYSNHLKEVILGVSSETLRQEGAVSHKAVQEMWHGL